MPGQKKAAFLTATLDFDVASVRYRAIYPALALERAGWLCELHPGPRTLRGRIEDFDVLIVVKLLDGGVVDVVAEAMDTDVPVVLDLCDDLLSRDYRSRLHSLHRLTMEAIGPDISRIVTTGPYLSRLLHARGIDPALMRIAPDCVETDADVVAAKTFAKTRAAPEATLTAAAISAAVGARRLQKNVLRAAGRAYGAVRHPLRAVKTLRAMADERRAGGRPESGMARAEESGEAALSLVGKSVIWFGNHGGPHSDFGVLTLLRIARELRAAHARAPFTLVVVSNDVEKFRLFIPAIGVPSIFVKWTHEMQARLLERASACVMPVGEDAFSQSKSSNRALLALQKGVPVVAQSLESLEPLKDCISIDDVEEGLVRALTDPQAVRADIERGRKIIEERFSLRAVGETWAAILEDAIAQAPKRHLLTRSSPEKLLVLIALLQDIDIAFPVIDEARKRGLEVAVIVSELAAQQSARLAEALIQRRIAPTFIRPEDAASADYRWLRNADALFCPSETTAAPHLVANYLTKMANSIGVKTYTVQHGVETLGLNYRDKDFPDPRISSRTVFVWSDPATLPDWVPGELRGRCAAVGRTPVLDTPHAVAGKPPLPAGRPAIGIFENLHWSRYDDAFRARFVDAVGEAARRRPDIAFIVKPHPAGRWTIKSGAAQRWPQNVTVASPLDGGWEPWPAGAMIPYLDAVVTTPSTVALDAAEAERPVAVFALEGDAGAYAPLARLDDPQSLARFIDDALASPDALLDQGRAFAARVRVGTDAASRMLDLMFPGSTGKAAEPAVRRAAQV